MSESAYQTVTTTDGLEISSNGESLDQMEAALTAPVSTDTPTDDADESEADATGEAPKADATKVDKRTREGRKQSIQAEIDALTNRRGETQREVDATQARLAQAKAELADLERLRPVAPSGNGTAHASTEAPADPEPQFDQFINEADAATAYYRAVAAWNGRNEARKLFEQQRAESHTRSLQQRTFDEQARTLSLIQTNQGVTDATEFLKRINPDVLQKATPASLMPAGSRVSGYNAIGDSVLASSHPDRILLHFTEQPAEFARIAQLPPHLALREMGILEGTLRAAAASDGPASRAKFSSASPPTKPLGGPPVVSADDREDFEDLSPDSVDKYILKSQAKRRR